MGTIDVVYKLGNGSKWNDSELRMSLRSLQNFTPLRSVYIIGWCPDWVQNVTFIPVDDALKSNKDGNLINKLILATTDPNLSEEFLNMSDDQVFLQQCGYDEIQVPYTENASLPKSDGQRHNRWTVRLERTVNALRQRGLATDCFESHLPCLHRKDLYARTLLQYDYGFDRGYVGNTLYYNTLGVKGRPLGPDTVARIVNPIEDRTQLAELCKNKQFLNYTEKALNDNLLLYLGKLFPEKSQYEK